MNALLAALVLTAQAAAPAPAPSIPSITAELTPLPIEQQTALRCSIAIAMAAEQQRAGQAADKGWPDLTTRGREFFVRSLAQLMDAAQLTRPMLQWHAQREVADLQQPGRLDEVMPACLLMLDASGL